MKGTRLRKIAPYLYVLPALGLAVLFCYAPFFATILDSVSHVRASGERIRFVGLENFQNLFASDSFHDSLRNTITFTLWFVPCNVLATFLSALLVHGKGKELRASRSALMATIAIAMGSIVLILKTLFDENTGLYNRILCTSVRWFSSPRAAMGMLVYTGIYLDFGFDFLLFSASLDNIPRDLYEVAALEGADPWQRLWYLEFPLTEPTMVFVVLNNLKDAFLICSPVMILTEGGPFRSTQTIVYQMYLEGFKGGNIAMGSALATVAFSMSLVLFLAGMALQYRRVFYQ